MMKFIPTAENYQRYRGEVMKCGRNIVRVTVHRTESRAGSWERGFRFSESKWGLLYRPSDQSYSMDHGKTWHANVKVAARMSKGKMRLESDSHGELAFEGIQAIKREYDASYRWRR